MNRFHARLPAVIILCFGFILWSPVIFSNNSLFFDLILRYFYPMASFFRETILRHELPLWNPHILCGMPFLANPQAGILYPPEWLFIVFSFPRALSLFLLFHTLLAGFGMYRLVRAYRLSAVSSVGASVVFMGNGFFVMHAAFPDNVAAYAWIPLVILFFLRACRKVTFPCILFSALMFTLQFLSGYPGFVYYTTLLCVASAIFFPLEKGIPARNFLITAAASALIAAALSMVLLLPLAELARYSARGGGLDFSTAATYAIHPKDLFRFLLVPFWDRLTPFYTGDVHIVGFYWGLVTLALALLRATRMDKTAAIFWGPVFLLSSLLSTGPATPLYRIFFNIVPGWRFFGFPAQVTAVSCIAMAFITAYALETVSRHAYRWTIVAMIAAELSIFAWSAHRTIDDSFYETPVPALSFLLSDNSQFRVMLTPATHSTPPQGDTDYFQRWLTYKNVLYPNTAAAYGISYVDGNETLQLTRTREYLEAIDSPLSPLLGLANMKYLISRKPLPSEQFDIANPGYTTIFKNRGCLPRFFLVPSSRVLPIDQILPYMASGSFRPEQEVVLEETPVENDGLPSLAARYDGKSTVSCEKYAANEVQCFVRTTIPQWLVASETWFPGWYAEIDGRPAKLQRADYMFRAVRVPSGTHQVRMVYRPWSVIIGSIVSFVTLLAAAAGLLFCRRKKGSL